MKSYEALSPKGFETTNPLESWDGTFKGSVLDNSVFAYTLKVKVNSGEEIIKKGNISLIR